MTQCRGCGAPITFGVCQYCGTPTKTPNPPRRVIRSSMGTFDDLSNVDIVGDMNTIHRAHNCRIYGDMNTVRWADAATMVSGDMNTVHAPRSPDQHANNSGGGFLVAVAIAAVVALVVIGLCF